MNFVKNILLIALACMALATQLASAEPRFGGNHHSPSGLNRPKSRPAPTFSRRF